MFVELYNHLRQLKKGYPDPVKITNRHPTHPYESKENYFYTLLEQDGDLTFVRLTKMNEKKIAHHLITTLMYEADRTDFESPTCKLHRQLLSKLNQRYATFTLKQYRDFIEEEEKKDDYFGELLSEDSDSEEERCYLEWPHRKQQVLYSFAHTLFERSQSDKLITKNGTFKKRGKFTGNGLGYDLMQRQMIVREAPLSIGVQQDLNRLNAFAIKGKLKEKQIKTIKTQFVVASYRGISYRMDEFSASDRRYHRRTSESSKPLFSRAILKMEGFKSYTEYLKALKQDPSLQRRMQVHANAVHDRLDQLAKSGPVNVHFLGENPYHFNNALEAIQDFYTKNYDKFHEVMRAIIHKFISSEEIPIEVLEDVILFSIQNKYSPFVSASDTPHHALRYAYAHKYYESYKDKRLRPRWRRRDGRAERPYSGKVYVALHDPISLLNNSQHVPSLNESSAVKIDIQTIAEREMSFLSYIPEGQVVSQHIAKYPSFKGPYKNIFLEKYGLDEALYEKFKEAITSSAPHSKERKHAKNLLTSHLVSFQEVCLIEEARLAAKKAGKVLVYRDEHGGFSEYPCRTTPPARSNNSEQQQVQQATRKQQSAKRAQREELAATSSSSGKRSKTSKSASSSPTGFLTHLVSQFNIYPSRSEKSSLISALTFFLKPSALQILDKNKQSLEWRLTDTYTTYFQRIKPYLTNIAAQQKVCIELYHPQHSDFFHSLGCSDHRKLRLYTLGGGEFAALWPRNEARPVALSSGNHYSFFSSDDDTDDGPDSALDRVEEDDEEEIDLLVSYSPEL